MYCQVLLFGHGWQVATWVPNWVKVNAQAWADCHLTAVVRVGASDCSQLQVAELQHRKTKWSMHTTFDARLLANMLTAVSPA